MLAHQDSAYRLEDHEYQQQEIEYCLKYPAAAPFSLGKRRVPFPVQYVMNNKQEKHSRSDDLVEHFSNQGVRH